MVSNPEPTVSTVTVPGRLGVKRYQRLAPVQPHGCGSPDSIVALPVPTFVVYGVDEMVTALAKWSLAAACVVNTQVEPPVVAPWLSRATTRQAYWVPTARP